MPTYDLAQKISQVTGVGLVSIAGGQKPAVRIQANPAQLTSYGLSLEDLRTSLAASNVDQAKGNLNGTRQSYTIPAQTSQLLSSSEYKPVIIAYRNGAPVRMSDVANVVDGAENTMQAAWMNDTPAVIVNVQRQPGANIIGVVDRIEKLLPILKASLPGVRERHRIDRPHDNDSRVGKRRPVHAHSHHRTRGDGDLSLPAQSCSDGYSQRCRSALAGWHVWRDVPAGIQPE